MGVLQDIKNGPEIKALSHGNVSFTVYKKRTGNKGSESR